MATDGNGDEPTEPTKLPLRPRPRAPLQSVAPAISRDPRVRVGSQRATFLTTYLGLLQEPDVVNNIRAILSSGKANEVAAVLGALVRVLIPNDAKAGTPVQVNLMHGVPRPPLDVTP